MNLWWVNGTYIRKKERLYKVDLFTCFPHMVSVFSHVQYMFLTSLPKLKQNEWEREIFEYILKNVSIGIFPLKQPLQFTEAVLK